MTDPSKFVRYSSSSQMQLQTKAKNTRSCLTPADSRDTLAVVNLDRARESLKAAELCLQEGLVNSAASRAYYTMFQAAQVALEAVDAAQRSEWSHYGLQAAFVTELIHRRKIYLAVFREYLSHGLGVRRVADYGLEGVSRKIAQRLVRRAASFVAAIEEKVGHEVAS